MHLPLRAGYDPHHPEASGGVRGLELTDGILIFNLHMTKDFIVGFCECVCVYIYILYKFLGNVGECIRGVSIWRRESRLLPHLLSGVEGFIY